VVLPKDFRSKENLSKMHTEICRLENKYETSVFNRQKEEV